jgi:hypothetical protein
VKLPLFPGCSSETKPRIVLNYQLGNILETKSLKQYHIQRNPFGTKLPCRQQPLNENYGELPVWREQEFLSEEHAKMERNRGAVSSQLLMKGNYKVLSQFRSMLKWKETGAQCLHNS